MMVGVVSVVCFFRAGMVGDLFMSCLRVVMLGILIMGFGGMGLLGMFGMFAGLFCLGMGWGFGLVALWGLDTGLVYS